MKFYSGSPANPTLNDYDITSGGKAEDSPLCYKATRGVDPAMGVYMFFGGMGYSAQCP